MAIRSVGSSAGSPSIDSLVVLAGTDEHGQPRVDRGGHVPHRGAPLTVGSTWPERAGGAPGDSGARTTICRIEVLLLCTGNICRSPMAEALLRHRAEQEGLDLTVSSAGILFDDRPATEEAVDAMARLGIDLSSHRSRVVRRRHDQGCRSRDRHGTTPRPRGGRPGAGDIRSHVHPQGVGAPWRVRRAETARTGRGLDGADLTRAPAARPPRRVGRRRRGGSLPTLRQGLRGHGRRAGRSRLAARDPALGPGRRRNGRV